MAERLRVAQVTPHAWERDLPVNVFVRRLSDELAARGHRVVVVAPSDSRGEIRESRALVRRAANDPDTAFGPAGDVRVIGAGQSLGVNSGRRGGRSLPLDVSRTIQDLLDNVPFDLVHVHDPWAPSAASAALRHSRALNVGTFHSATEKAVTPQMARRIVALLFGRLDGRVASFAAIRDLLARAFPGEWATILPGSDPVATARAGTEPPIEIFYGLDEERAGLRLFLRALRRLPSDLPWHATIWSASGAVEPAVPLPRALRERVRFAGPEHGHEADHLARAHLAVHASSGVSPAPELLLRTMAAGAVPVASRIAPYEELLADGERGLLFETRDAETLAGQLERLLADPALRDRFRARIDADASMLTWSRVADEYEALYGRLAARRADPDADRPVRARLRSRPFVHVDLHMHTDHSPDCATPVDHLLSTASARGLDVIAVTDHNEISGALAAREQAEGIRVIVAEEVKTADQGEVIGLFIEEKIARGMTLEETIAEIHRQGGLVYVPHPFDRLHSVPDYEHLLRVVEQIDAIEVFNPRVAISAFNEEAARFAAKYRIVAGAGSDSHVVQGLGSVKIRMRDFEGPTEFLASLRDADIIRKRQSLLYVQALKFIQTHGAPPAAGRSVGK